MRFVFSRKLLVQLIVITLLAAGVAWIVLHSSQPNKAPPMRGAGPVPVGTAVAAHSDLPVIISALGTVTPLATVTVKTQIAGQLTQVAFTEGQLVHKGDFLAQIDPRPYQAQLDQYQGQLQRDQSLLRTAELDLERYKTLVAEDSIARQQMDTQASLVQQDKGVVETDKAQVANARLNLTYCHIIAPITGRVGLRQIDQGNYVQTSDANGLVVITQIQPITVLFTIAEDQIPALVKRYRSGATLAVATFDRSGQTKLADGKVLTIDNQIDTATGTVKVKAVFDNQDESLYPNQFVNVQVNLDTISNAVAIPTAALLRGAPGTYVYLVKADNTVTVRPVKIGPATSDKIAILDGLAEGDTVVVDGTDKLREGAAITIPSPTGQGQDPGQPKHKHRSQDQDKHPKDPPE